MINLAIHQSKQHGACLTVEALLIRIRAKPDIDYLPDWVYSEDSLIEN